MNHRRLQLKHDPYSDGESWNFWFRANWPCFWIRHPAGMTPPGGWRFKLQFQLDSSAVIPLHVTADELYDLSVDGERIGRGPQRGTLQCWHFESYEIELDAGQHVIQATVWAFGEEIGPHGIMGIRPGFLLGTNREFHEKLATGVAPWQTKAESCCCFTKNEIGWGTGPEIVIYATALSPDAASDGWFPAENDTPGINGALAFHVRPAQAHCLLSSNLPPMLEKPCPPAKVRFVDSAEADRIDMQQHLDDQESTWVGIWHGRPARIPENSRRRILFDLDNYVCAYPSLTVNGGRGATVRLNWAESLFVEPDATPFPPKGDRDEIEGKVFRGYGDTFIPDGERQTFSPPLWRPGRYLELFIDTADEEIEIEELRLAETHYPLEISASFQADHPAISTITPIMVRALEMCMHQTYFDCPYYEQLMYIGDTRLQALVTYVLSGDDRLPRQAIRMFAQSIQSDGLLRAHYPGRDRQTIAPFSLWWIGMVYDFARWRDEPGFVKSNLNTMRAIQNAWLKFLNPEGLIEGPRGWNFTDWVPEWPNGVPPDGEFGVSGILNLHFLLALRWCEELEEQFGEPELAARAQRHADRLYNKICEVFWDHENGLFADTLDHRHRSEHANALAVLTGMIDAPRLELIKKALRENSGLTRTTIYFSHYLFEACAHLGMADLFIDRLDCWTDAVACGFKTTPEMPEPTRSDCHAWGAHPLYHFHASLLGAQPGFGFKTVDIRPQFGKLTSICGRLPTPHGMIEFELERHDKALNGSITLPPGITGTLHWGGQRCKEWQACKEFNVC